MYFIYLLSMGIISNVSITFSIVIYLNEGILMKADLTQKQCCSPCAWQHELLLNDLIYINSRM